MRRFAEIDRRVYAELLSYRDRMEELLGGKRWEQEAAAPVAAQVRRLVAKSLGLAEDNIRADSSLRNLGVDSLDLVVLAMSLEEAFKIEFSPSDVEDLCTFADLVHRVGELRAAPV